MLKHTDHIISYNYGKLWLCQNDKFNKDLKDGVYQDHIVNWAKTWARKNSNIVDAGANIGIFTVPFSQIIGVDGNHHVHSFEPSKHTFDLLTKTVGENKLDNVILHNKALSNKPGLANLYHPSTNLSNISTGYASLDIAYDKKDSLIPTEKVEVVTLDEFNLNDISFIKVDIQNYEYPFLQGAIETLNRTQCALVLELPLRNNKEIKAYEDCVDLLQTIDYTIAERIGGKDALFLPKNRVTPQMLKSQKTAVNRYKVSKNQSNRKKN